MRDELAGRLRGSIVHSTLADPHCDRTARPDQRGRRKTLVLRLLLACYSIGLYSVTIIRGL